MRATGHGALTEKFAHPLCDETADVFQREGAGINQLQFRVWKVSFISFGAFNSEKGIVLPPENQHSRLSLAEELMPAVIERDIRLITVQRIALTCRITL